MGIPCPNASVTASTVEGELSTFVAVQRECLVTCLDGLCVEQTSLGPHGILHICIAHYGAMSAPIMGLCQRVVCLRLRPLGGMVVHVRCRCSVLGADGRNACCVRLLSSRQQEASVVKYLAACCIDATLYGCNIVRVSATCTCNMVGASCGLMHGEY